MNATDRDILRNRILQSIAPTGRTGLPAATIGDHCRAAGFKLGGDDLSVELDYLEDKGLLAVRASALSAGLKRYALTAAGRDYLEAENLI